MFSVLEVVCLKNLQIIRGGIQVDAGIAKVTVRVQKKSSTEKKLFYYEKKRPLEYSRMTMGTSANGQKNPD